MHDRVDYALPLAPAGELAHRLVRRQLRRIFAYRHAVMLRLFAASMDQPFIIHFDHGSPVSQDRPPVDRPVSAPRTKSALE